MHALRVKGKSTRGIRGVYVLIDESLKQRIQQIIDTRPEKSPRSDYIFARFENAL